MRTAFSSPDWDSYADPSVRTILCRGRLSGSISQGTLLKQETLLENHKPCAVVRRPSMSGQELRASESFTTGQSFFWRQRLGAERAPIAGALL